jgi:redox-sensitive bicupin YhaK (pirin superfamily)
MRQVRRAEERGHAHHGWLETWHTFSFAEYQDPKHMQFRSLRVMNEDWVAPGQGFGTHPHRDMEIVTYVLEGELEHRDSIGHGEVLRPGEFQRMTAGTGITHSEFNPSMTQPVHLYQIWLFPDRRGLPPSYEQTKFDASQRTNRWRLVASPDGADGSLRVHQDARIYLANVEIGQRVQHHLHESRHAWLQVLRGAVTLDDVILQTGDGLAVSEETSLDLAGVDAAEVMLFDLA